MIVDRQSGAKTPIKLKPYREKRKKKKGIPGEKEKSKWAIFDTISCRSTEDTNLEELAEVRERAMEAESVLWERDRENGRRQRGKEK